MAVLNNNKSQKGLSSAGLGFGCCLCSAAYLAVDKSRRAGKRGGQNTEETNKAAGQIMKVLIKDKEGRHKRGR